MLNFIVLKRAVQEQFGMMAMHNLFKTDVSKDDLWDTYLNSFPEGSNPVFRERTGHDCQCCKQFIRACGDVVSILGGKKVSIWDINVGGHYQVVANALSVLVKSKDVSNVFLNAESQLGTDKNRELTEAGDIVNTWEHFYYKLPSKFVKRGSDIGSFLSEKHSSRDVFKRGLEEITTSSINIVLELIEQNSLYRGQEHTEAVAKFAVELVKYRKLKTDTERDLFSWDRSASIGGLSRLRNSVIGTLLVDLSNGVGLDIAVKSFETKVAPANYKRSSALITRGMIEQAQKKVAELGIAGSLPRRFAVSGDISVNNILFVDRGTASSLCGGVVDNVFSQMNKETTTKIGKLDKIEEIGISEFVDRVLPKATSLEVLFENSQESNLMSLIAPINIDSKQIFKWNNNFSWSYNGEVADSIRERVKRAGGNVSGILRCSLSWLNYDDLDIHIIEPDGNHIGYQKKIGHISSGKLDVDMNASSSNLTRNSVENITWDSTQKMQEGIYTLYINQFCQRETFDFGFVAEVEHGGNLYTFYYPKVVKNNITVAEFEFSKKHGVKFVNSIPSTKSTKEVWGVSTNHFHKVKMLMNSPNHWDGNQAGNKHWFFILEDCNNPKKARGFYNEFLDNTLTAHRKVFEVMASKMKTEPSNEQLSGLGFSSTQRSHLICKVSGSFTRTLKISF